ncbi:hypothetical protein CARUB_v10021244mg [Capsella rubella]|uniref:Transmembrane protein n=1 Tax=Capsella rubella TaxID=81985 RepID=R0ICT2_9BRAS|nr:uncharacterized protein LOC17895228 [Capsella rubella]EOA35980.1 hypothetical protein CARUB_v10021244mg [Capsella rubella]
MAKMPRSSSKLLAMMLFSFLALFIISHADHQVVFPDTPSNSYAPPIYAPVPDECFNPPYHCSPPGESLLGHMNYNQNN